MTTTTERPREIRAIIHQDAISRVSRFFNATVTDCINEILQNARRAEATQVDIKIDGREITVYDNGYGVEDPASLLAFGHSQWNQETRVNEDPAGMGVYSLATKKDVVITSRPRHGDQTPWRVYLNENHFRGLLHATVETVDNDEEVLYGTTVSFVNEYNYINQDEIRRCLKYYPVPTTLNGKEAETEEFLHEAVRINEWQGLQIGVFKTHSIYTSSEANFHGIVVGDSKINRIDTGLNTWYVKLNIIKSPELELTLPSRKEIVQNDFFHRMNQECLRQIFLAIAADDGQNHISAEDRKKAGEMGIDIPESPQELRRWHPRYLEYSPNNKDPNQPRVPVSMNTMLVDYYMDNENSQVMMRAASLSGRNHDLRRTDRNMEGYPWYDQLDHIKGIRMTVVPSEGDEPITINPSQNAYINNPYPERVHAITVTLHIQEHDGTYRFVELPTDLAFASSSYNRQENEPVVALITNNSRITSAQLADIMADTFIDVKHGSTTPQSVQWKEQAEELRTQASRMILNPVEATKENVEHFLGREMANIVPEDQEVTIRVRGRQKPQVEVRTMNGDKAKKENNQASDETVPETETEVVPEVEPSPEVNYGVEVETDVE